VLETGRITFGSFNSCYKLTPTVVGLWARVLKAVEGSRLIVYAVTGARAQSRLRELFAASGIFAGRVELRVRVSHEAFLKAHQEVDIALDSYPYHGTTTTCFSLWMGVPVVSLVGPTHVSRVGLTLLSSVDLDALAASDCDGYVEAAAALAQDAQRLAALRSGLRERMLASALTDGVACARSLESAYRRMWRDWCSETLGGTS
jgi:predicted O-linked N-acetylglucosamine transferase (SPINDLY family)